MASNFGNIIPFSTEEIATTPLDATRQLATATQMLLTWQQFPASIEYGSDKPIQMRGDLSHRSFTAVHLGVHDLYVVDTSLVGTTVRGGRPLVNQVRFLFTAGQEVLEPVDILQVRLGYPGKVPVDERLLQPKLVIAELGYSAMKLVEGISAASHEFWTITDRCRV